MNTELPDENNSKHCNFKKRKRRIVVLSLLAMS